MWLTWLCGWAPVGVCAGLWRWCRQNMGRRYIEVFHAKRSDYYNAISQTWGSGDNQGQGGGQGQGERGGAGPR